MLWPRLQEVILGLRINSISPTSATKTVAFYKAQKGDSSLGPLVVNIQVTRVIIVRKVAMQQTPTSVATLIIINQAMSFAFLVKPSKWVLSMLKRNLGGLKVPRSVPHSRHIRSNYNRGILSSRRRETPDKSKLQMRWKRLVRMRRISIIMSVSARSILGKEGLLPKSSKKLIMGLKISRCQ